MASTWYVDFSLTGSSGTGVIGDPYSWDQFITSEAGSLVGTGENIVYCRGRGDRSSSDSLDSDFTTDATGYLHFQAWPGFKGTDTDVTSYPGLDTKADWIHITVDNQHTKLTGLGFTNSRATPADNSRNVQFSGGQSGVNEVYDCIFDAGQAGRSVHIESDVTFYNCLFASQFVHVSNWYTPTFWHCSCVNSASNGFYNSGANSDSTFYNCLAWGNTNANADYPTAGAKTMDGCAGEDDFSGTDSNYTLFTASHDPFTDQANGDYTLQPGAECIDKGVHPGSGLTTDLIGNPRTVGAFPDCGPIEWQAAAVGFKPLLQRSTVGNKLYDGTIL